MKKQSEIFEKHQGLVTLSIRGLQSACADLRREVQHCAETA